MIASLGWGSWIPGGWRGPHAHASHTLGHIAPLPRSMRQLGKSVLCEKPMANSVAEAESMASAAIRTSAQTGAWVSLS